MKAPRALVTFLAIAAACSSAPAAPSDASADAPPTDVASSPDAAPDADPSVDGDAREGGGACAFNRDCVASERCACSEADGCRCAPGARGAGVAGVDRCASGNDCASALCLEGPGGVALCSAPCASPAECPASLPRCVSVSTVGRICARDPSATVDAGAGTALTARFGSATGGFDRAQHGVVGTDGVLVEAHFGGDPACPTMSSPTPRRTLVLSGVRAGRPGVQTRADGVSATLLDFGGDLTSAPLARATSIEVTPRAIDRGASVSLEITATFPGGTVTGSFVAPHCASLDTP